jgi:hypothetical protein
MDPIIKDLETRKDKHDENKESASRALRTISGYTLEIEAYLGILTAFDFAAMSTIEDNEDILQDGWSFISLNSDG